MQNLASALAGFHADVGRLLKQSTAQYGKYADLATVLATVSEPLGKHGLVVTQTFSPFENGTTLLRTTLLHTSGEQVCSDLPMPAVEGARNVLHAFGAATTYLRRYALLAILNLAAEDDDGDSFGADQRQTQRSAPRTGTDTKPSPAKREPLPVSPADQLLAPAEKKRLMDSVKALGTERIKALQPAFRTHFKLAPDVAISDYFNTRSHADFINEWIAGAVSAVPA
jgi:hypothetical protein